jgi:hypothetical protein
MRASRIIALVIMTVVPALVVNACYAAADTTTQGATFAGLVASSPDVTLEVDGTVVERLQVGTTDFSVHGGVLLTIAVDGTATKVRLVPTAPFNPPTELIFPCPRQPCPPPVILDFVLTVDDPNGNAYTIDYSTPDFGASYVLTVTAPDGTVRAAPVTKGTVRTF